MKKFFLMLIVMAVVSVICSCAAPPDRYNTQQGAVIGAGLGAIAGQAIGHNAKATLLGTGIGMLLGTIAGNAADQGYQAGREAAAINKRIVYYDNRGAALEAIPGQYNPQTKCRKITKRVWENGRMVKEIVEEICETDRYIQD